MDEAELPAAARCQQCHTLTSRKCSVCSVCIYCSGECEAKAATLCFADVACKLHRALPHEETNIGSASAHFLMLPSTQTDLTARASPQLRWTALHNAAVHYLHILLACSPSRLYQKTAFGMAAVLTPEFRYSCGCQRLRFLGKTSQVATKIVGNMGKLALAQMGEERRGTPRLRDDDGARDERQAVIVSGFVAKSRTNNSSYVVHFDCIYVTHNKNAWTVRRVQPLWEQKLTPLDHKLYKMDFKPDGCVPSNERHPLPLLESALNPPAAQPPAPPLPTMEEMERMPSLGSVGSSLAMMTPNLSPTLASSTPPEATLPPSVVAAADQEGEEEGEEEEEGAMAGPPPSLAHLPPTAQWEDYLAVAQAQAEAQAEAPEWATQVAAAVWRA